MAANVVTFRIIDEEAPNKACGPNVREAAQKLADRAAANTPVVTGLMRRSWRVDQDRDPATWIVANTVSYARNVEYGTSTQRARAPLGRALAAGGGG
jgi:Bacteriophage HK97-gp10, putative tail-component